GQNLFDRQRRRRGLVANALPLGEERGQRLAPGQAAEPFAQRRVDVGPHLPRSGADRAAVLVGPAAGALLVVVAQARTGSCGRGGRSCLLRTPGCSARSWASDEPPGRVRRPRRRALSTFRQFNSLGSSVPSVVLVRGQRPVRAWWASHQTRICGTVRGGRLGMD